MPLTDEQIEQRKSGLGSSDIPRVISDPHAVWLEKTGRAEPFAGNEFTEWGDLMEPILHEKARERWPDEFRQRNDRTWVGAEPWMLATPDGIRLEAPSEMFLDCEPTMIPGDPIGVDEYKTANAYMAREWGDEDTDEIPTRYLLQVQWQQGVTGLTAPARVVAEINHRFRYYEVEHHPKLFEKVAEIGRRFWWHVENDTPPEMDGSDAARDTLLALYPQAPERDWMLADESTLALVEEYRLARQAAAEAEVRKKALEQRICEALGSHYGIRGDGWSITWGNRTGRKTIDAKGLADHLGAKPEDIERFTKRGADYRVFSARFGGE